MTRINSFRSCDIFGNRAQKICSAGVVSINWQQQFQVLLFLHNTSLSVPHSLPRWAEHQNVKIQTWRWIILSFRNKLADPPSRIIIKFVLLLFWKKKKKKKRKRNLHQEDKHTNKILALIPFCVCCSTPTRLSSSFFLYIRRENTFTGRGGGTKRAFGWWCWVILFDPFSNNFSSLLRR